MDSLNQKTAEHLMHLITTRNNDIPNFSMLLGAGASITSGVRTATDMINEWRKLLYDRSANGEGYQSWLRRQRWFEHEDEYSILFEEVFDQPAQRRVHIEECVKKAHPSWGYVYLTDLLAQRFFDVIFTTNFDDLINEACYLYSSDLRPIVAAHDSAVQGIRVTSSRPKIIKLHGDFLYDNIKNTLAELETLETNTKRKLRQFAQEYGLIVIGYSGRDRSVMDTLDLLLRDDDNYRQGVYWCIRKGDAVESDRLISLLRRERIYIVEVDGFDEFMADLHKALGLALPKPVAQPFEMARDRARLFVENPLRSHPVIGAHVNEVLRNISTPNPRVPLTLEAVMLSSTGKLQEAIPMWRQAYIEDPTNEHIAHGYADSLVEYGNLEELTAFVLESPLSNSNKTYFLLRANKNQEVIDLATKALFEQPNGAGNRYEDRAFVRINRAIAFKRLGDHDKMIADLDILDQDSETLTTSIKAGIAALRGDKVAMFLALNECLHKTIGTAQLSVFPVFEDYKDDPEFQELIKS